MVASPSRRHAFTKRDNADLLQGAFDLFLSLGGTTLKFMFSGIVMAVAFAGITQVHMSKTYHYIRYIGLLIHSIQSALERSFSPQWHNMDKTVHHFQHDSGAILCMWITSTRLTLLVASADFGTAAVLDRG